MDEPLPLRRQRVLRLIEWPATSTAAAVRSRTIRKQPLRTRTSDGRFDRTAASSPALIVVFLSKERSVGHALRLVGTIGMAASSCCGVWVGWGRGVEGCQKQVEGVNGPPAARG